MFFYLHACALGVTILGCSGIDSRGQSLISMVLGCISEEIQCMSNHGVSVGIIIDLYTRIYVSLA